MLARVACRGRDVTSPRVRGLLALLAGEPRGGVSAARLVEGLWADDRPANPAKALQVVVSRARSALGADIIASTPTGYRLGLDETEVDACAVLLAASACARRARDGDHAGALSHADEGLALWDGPPKPDEGDDALSLLRAERAPTYWTLRRARALALARLGRHADGFEALASIAGEYPRDEEVLAELLRCEASAAGPSRHRTMRAVVDWSWNLLSPSGRAAMRMLSVFPGGFTADAARHLLDDTGVLEDLVGQSLLSVAEDGAGTRFLMLESVREFSASHRDAKGETERAVDGLLAWAREFGAAHHEALFGADPNAPLERVRTEQDNLLQAFRHGLARRDGPAVAAATAVLGGLWTLESAFTRMITMVEESAGVLSRFRPGPEDVDVTRTALALSVLTTVMLKGPRVTRALVALRRLPAAPPDSLVRALAVLVGSAPEILGPDRTALGRMRAGDHPLLAALADCVTGYVREHEGDLAGALEATEAMAEVAETAPSPWLRLIAHSRLSELLMQTDRPDEAAHHLRASLDFLGRYGWPDMFGLLWALAAVHLHLGELDEAERLLEQSIAEGPYDSPGMATFSLGARAEIAFGRGDAETGLRLWREAVARLADEEIPVPALGLDPWTVDTHCVTVIAHARHGRLDLVRDLAGGLPGKLSALLAEAALPLPPAVMDLPICGALLLALAMVDDDRARAARRIALAERMHFSRSFQPTMSPAAARRAALDADEPAYRAAVAEYAGLSREGLWDAARALATGAPSG